MSSSANEDNTQFVWNGVDERNLSLLFWNTEEDQTSKRLVSLLRIQAEAERLSKNRKRRRIQSSRNPKDIAYEAADKQIGDVADMSA